jgi:hypothetical protein
MQVGNVRSALYFYVTMFLVPVYLMTFQSISRFLSIRKLFDSTVYINFFFYISFIRAVDKLSVYIT